MPLYEYRCTQCQAQFEEVTSREDPEAGRCPKCDFLGSPRLISRFAVGGQGDLRETSAYHGCHSALDVDRSHDAHDDSHECS